MTADDQRPRRGGSRDSGNRGAGSYRGRDGRDRDAPADPARRRSAGERGDSRAGGRPDRQRRESPDTGRRQPGTFGREAPSQTTGLIGQMWKHGNVCS